MADKTIIKHQNNPILQSKFKEHIRKLEEVEDLVFQWLKDANNDPNTRLHAFKHVLGLAKLNHVFERMGRFRHDIKASDDQVQCFTEIDLSQWESTPQLPDKNAQEDDLKALGKALLTKKQELTTDNTPYRSNEKINID